MVTVLNASYLGLSTIHQWACTRSKSPTQIQVHVIMLCYMLTQQRFSFENIHFTGYQEVLCVHYCFVFTVSNCLQFFFSSAIYCETLTSWTPPGWMRGRGVGGVMASTKLHFSWAECELNVPSFLKINTNIWSTVHSRRNHGNRPREGKDNCLKCKGWTHDLWVQ